MKIYKGSRSNDSCTVTVNGEPLDPRFDLRELSSSGFEWGYDGAGPGQLALAILADYFGDDAKALQFFSSFRSHVIASLDSDEWHLTNQQIENSLTGVVEVPMTLKELMNKVKGVS